MGGIRGCPKGPLHLWAAGSWATIFQGLQPHTKPSLAGASSSWGQILTHLGSLRGKDEAGREEPKTENQRTRTQRKEALCQQGPKSPVRDL